MQALACLEKQEASNSNTSFFGYKVLVKFQGLGLKKLGRYLFRGNLVEGL